uniref:Uncharacterized protein n=1 Tax=viral metagenome TaxID=1070528 RepID=A0A6M3JKU1_9ZZZZ
MCNHVFVFPEDKPGNYNPGGVTLKGRCKCGATQDAYGMRWMIPRVERFIQQNPFGEISLFNFKDDKVW